MSRRPDTIARVAALLSLAVAAAVLPACTTLRATARGTSAFFSSPRKVDKAKEPIVPGARLAVTWVGHATALVQIEDKVILTDPVFTSTAGQLSRRLVEPGIDPKDLPPVDAVLVSNLRADHLSLGSLELIAPKVRTLLVPRGGTAYVTDGFSFPSYELMTWQAWEKDGLRVTAAPVHHGGGRYGVDAAWMKGSSAAYVVEYHDIKVYFAGDTAYDQRNFVATGQRFPGIDLALLPVGPIAPHEAMRRSHLDAYQAVQAFVDLGAKRMVPIGFDTFVTSTDQPGDALRQLALAEKKWDLGERKIVPLAIGERRVLIEAEPKPAESEPETPSAEEPRDEAPKDEAPENDAPESKPPPDDDDDFD